MPALHLPLQLHRGGGHLGGDANGLQSPEDALRHPATGEATQPDRGAPAEERSAGAAEGGAGQGLQALERDTECGGRGGESQKEDQEGDVQLAGQPSQGLPPSPQQWQRQGAEEAAGYRAENSRLPDRLQVTIRAMSF